MFILSNGVQREMGIVVQRFRKHLKTNDEIYVAVRCKGQPEAKDTVKQLHNIYEKYSELHMKPLLKKKTPVW